MVAALAPALAFDDVSLSFRSVRALSHVSFAVRRGEICALIGPNGAGKSSLLNVACGVYRPDRGAIVVAGERLVRPAPQDVARRGVARTFQNLALFRGMSVIDNVLAGRALLARSGVLAQALGLNGREEAAHAARAEELLAVLQLADVKHALVGELAYGVQKRVELARALAAEPSIVLLDEPLAGMIAAEKHALCGAIVDVHERLGATILLVEHDVGVVMDLADHVVVLDHGEKIADGAPADVRRDPAVIAAYLGAAA